jgi:hypothetical protein
VTSQALQSNHVFDCVINGLGLSTRYMCVSTDAGSGRLQLAFVLGKQDREIIDLLASPEGLARYVWLIE